MRQPTRSARIFISYRSADGVDKATALARDLGQRFGDAAVFLDKDDLRGGSAWRAEIASAIDARPVLLLLLTPQLLAAVDDQGGLRIADPADPVRRELESALDAGAQVIPVLCDGLDDPPASRRLPPPFDRIGDFTWRRLRAFDWANDVDRLAGDLEALGISRAAATTPAAAPADRHGRPLWVGLLAGIAATAALLWLLARPAALASVAGTWQGRLWQGEAVVLVVTETAGKLTLASQLIAIADRPDWADYRGFWRQRTGSELDTVVYRGEGRRSENPGQPPQVDFALALLPGSGGDDKIDGGNLSLRLSPDGRTLTGRIWRNGPQAEHPAVLTRLR